MVSQWQKESNYVSLNLARTDLPWLRRSFAGLTPRRPGYVARSVRVGFVAHKVTLGQIFSGTFGLSSK